VSTKIEGEGKLCWRRIALCVKIEKMGERSVSFFWLLERGNSEGGEIKIERRKIEKALKRVR
jgi:hypothetical protein